MITSDACQELVSRTMLAYLAECGAQTPQDQANVLMTLASACAFGLVVSAGVDEAVARLTSTIANAIQQVSNRPPGATLQ